MSIQAMTWVWEHSESEGNARLVMLKIANSANDEGEDAYPSQETIARHCRISVRTVRRIVAQLVKTGELEVIQNGGGSRYLRDDRRPNLYRFPKMAGHNGRTQPCPPVAKPAPKQVKRADTTVSSRDGSRADIGGSTGGHGVSYESPSRNSLKNVDLFQEDDDLRSSEADGSPETGDEPDEPVEVIHAGHVVAAWSESYVAHVGRQPTQAMRAQVGRCAKELLQDTPGNLVVIAAQQAGEKGYPTLDREIGPLLIKHNKGNAARRDELLRVWSLPIPPDDVINDGKRYRQWAMDEQAKYLRANGVV